MIKPFLTEAEQTQYVKPFNEKTAKIKGIAGIKEKEKANDNNRRAAAKIRSYRNNGMNWLTIAQELNKAGVRTSKGKFFQAVQVQRIYYKIGDCTR